MERLSAVNSASVHTLKNAERKLYAVTGAHKHLRSGLKLLQTDVSSHVDLRNVTTAIDPCSSKVVLVPSVIDQTESY